MTIDQAIKKAAASYTSSGSISSATKKSLARRGLDCDTYGVYLTEVKPRVQKEARRQEKIQEERRKQRSRHDRLNGVSPAATMRTARRNLGRALPESRRIRRDFQEQDKNKRYVVPAPGEPFGSLIIEPVEEIREDRDYYSKSWHRKHGPKVTVEGRYVRLCRIDIWTGRLEEVSRTDEFVESGFRGDWLLSSAARLLSSRLPHGVSVAPRWQKEGGRSLRRVQLHERCRVEKVREIGNVRVYCRTLAGLDVDYCATLVNERGTVEDTFHAEDDQSAIQGLRIKRQKAAEETRAKKKGELITRRMLRKELGFCSAGIEGAASALGVSAKESITADALAERVYATPPRRISQYRSELRRVAQHLGREDLIQGFSHARSH